MGWVNKQSNIKKHQQGAKLEESGEQNIFDMVKNILSDAGEVAGDVTSSAVKKVGEGYEMTTDFISETGEKIGEKVVNLIDDNYETQNQRALRKKEEYENRKKQNEKNEHFIEKMKFSNEYSDLVEKIENYPTDFREVPLEYNEFMDLSDIDKRHFLDKYNIPLTNEEKLQVAMNNRDIEINEINKRIDDLILEKQYINNEVTSDSLTYEWMNVHDNMNIHMDTNRLSDDNIKFDKYMLESAKKYFSEQGISIEGPQGPPEAPPEENLYKPDNDDVEDILHFDDKQIVPHSNVPLGPDGLPIDEVKPGETGQRKVYE